MRAADPRRLLKRYNLRPRRSLGQNFLVNQAAPAQIVAGAEVGPDDAVLEVGAGLGTLTAELAAQAGRVIAVETDPHLVAALRDMLGTQGNVEIVHGDILTLDPASLLAVSPPPHPSLWGSRLENYMVVANLPYYITGAVIRHILEAPVRPARMVVTVQREVAQRIVAVPGKMSLLAVSVQFYGRPRVLLRLKRGAFYPVPAVESAVLRLDLYESPPVDAPDVAFFFRVVRAGFAQRRKQLRNTLSATLQLSPPEVAAALTAVDVASTRRAETLSLEEWGRVAGALQPLLAF